MTPKNWENVIELSADIGDANSNVLARVTLERVTGKVLVRLRGSKPLQYKKNPASNVQYILLGGDPKEPAGVWDLK